MRVFVETRLLFESGAFSIHNNVFVDCGAAPRNKTVVQLGQLDLLRILTGGLKSALIWDSARERR